MKNGFTLPEVLITLGIIGIVAAITLPTLISNYRKKVYSSNLKEFYSIMSQAITLSEAENGPKEYWGFSGNFETNKAGQFIEVYLLPYIKNIKQDAGKSNEFILENGVTVRVWSGSCLDFYTDINGKAKPNIVGKDIYYFTTCFSRKEPFEPYLYNKTMTRAELLEQCKFEPKHCSSLLFYDNWEYKDDYPFKI